MKDKKRRLEELGKQKHQLFLILLSLNNDTLEEEIKFNNINSMLRDIEREITTLSHELFGHIRIVDNGKIGK